MTTRLTPPERKVFAERVAAERKRDRYGRAASSPEPALGSLDERLGILVRRLGGTTGPIRVGPSERRWLEGQGWA